MPVLGRKLTENPINNHPPTYEWVEVPDIPFKGPKLPRRPDGGKWLPRTQRWWHAISCMPHCVLWTEADWDFAETTLLVAADVHEVNPRHAGELRNREKVLGVTLDYRRDLRIRYVPAEKPAPVEVQRLDDYRDL